MFQNQHYNSSKFRIFNQKTSNNKFEQTTYDNDQRNILARSSRVIL